MKDRQRTESIEEIIKGIRVGDTINIEGNDMGSHLLGPIPTAESLPIDPEYTLAVKAYMTAKATPETSAEVLRGLLARVEEALRKAQETSAGGAPVVSGEPEVK